MSEQPYIVRCYTKRGDRAAEFWHKDLEQAELRRETWILATGIKDPAKFPTIWQWNPAKKNYIRVAGY